MPTINELKNDDKVVNFSKIETLKNEDPKDFHTKQETSSKYKVEREAQIENGLAVIGNAFPNTNPLILLLGKWWEVKTARAEVKKLIDKEAKKEGYDKNQYLQEILKEDVEKLADLSEAINRIKYAVNYFKPRTPQDYKIPMKQISIDGEIYEIAIKLFETAKNDKLSKAKLRNFVIENGNKIETIEEL